MADQQEHDENNELDGISDEDAKRLLDEPEGNEDDSETDESESRKPTGQRSEGGNSELDKWKRMSRKNERELRETQRKLKEYEDQNKTEAERQQEATESYRTRAEKSETELSRFNVALATAPDGPIDPAVLRKVIKRMAGDSEDALEEDAKELWADLAPASQRRVAGKPQERSAGQGRPRGGSDPDDEPDEMDPRKLAARIPRAR